jgi:hypothetical protein
MSEPEKDPRQLLLERFVAVEARALRARLPQGMGFILCVFDFGEKEFLAYSSNAQRDGAIATLKELLAVLEGGQ